MFWFSFFCLAQDQPPQPEAGENAERLAESNKDMTWFTAQGEIRVGLLFNCPP